MVSKAARHLDEIISGLLTLRSEGAGRSSDPSRVIFQRGSSPIIHAAYINRACQTRLAALAALTLLIPLIVQ